MLYFLLQNKGKKMMGKALWIVTAVIVLGACERSPNVTIAAQQTGRESADLNASVDDTDVTKLLALAKSASNASPPDERKAFELYLKAANAGSLEATYEVADRHLHSKGVRFDYNTYVAWMENAASRGYVLAQYSLLAQKYFVTTFGAIELLPDPEMPQTGAEQERYALGLWTQLYALAERGVKKAAVDYAVFMNGDITLFIDPLTQQQGTKGIQFTGSADKARALLTPLANDGDAYAQRILAIWSDQHASSKSETSAVDWWSKLASSQDAYELFQVGHYYLASNTGDYRARKNKPRLNGSALSFEETNKEAYRWFQKAADLGNVNAASKLAMMHKTGLGTWRNVDAAFMWWKKAAELGAVDAQTEVARAYIDGIGVVKDWNKGFEWAMKAATHPTAMSFEMLDAMLIVGKAYTQGIVAEKDAAIGYAWVNIAASMHQQDAVNLRSVLERKLTAAEIREGQKLASDWKLGERVSRVGAATNGATVEGEARRKSEASASIQGSGFFINKNGHILTNYHVVTGCNEIRLRALSATADVVVTDKVNDLAVLHTSFSPTKVPALADSSVVKQGQDVIVFGYPLNDYLPSSGNVTTGLVSALAGPANNSNLIQISAPVQPGNSGGPVLNRKGEVMGVVVGKVDAIKVAKITGDIPQNVNFAISVDTARRFLDTNQIAFNTSSWLAASKETTELADAARLFTVNIECVK